MKLTEMKCVPCEGGVPPFDKKKITLYSKQLPKGWQVVKDRALQKEFKFKSFPETMAFVNKVALIAQEEGHHPDMEVHYSRVLVELSTHAVGGLSENDFILAAKIDR
ncbi:MAG: 4a-hydroxytetrahydrobiopterin dehydratase [Candidatus Doudnabacteria bacterium]|nr:4a-hydroxytetrahydrobiopterin dehydratase [Candidatus Doudnabacteria bacterium]